MMKRAIDIYSLLPTGKENAIRSVELMNLTGISSKRELGRTIKAARETHIIGADRSARGGYYIPKDQAEIAEWLRSQDHRGRSTLAATKTARNELRQCEGQESISRTEAAD